MRLFRAPSTLIALLLCALVRADIGSIRVSVFPQMAMADARSTVTVTAEVREGNGRPVPNGTQVVFQTTLGHFQQTAVATADGYARATLVTAGSPGTAKITASAISVGATDTAELEMVASRNDLASANFYIDVLAPKSLSYSMDDQVLSASGNDQSVKVRFGKVSVDSDDVQYKVSTNELRARHAKVTLKGHTYQFSDLVMTPTTRSGFGTTAYSSLGIVGFMAVGHMVVFSTGPQHHFGLVQLSPSGDIKPVSPDQMLTKFDFDDLSETTSNVKAKRAVIFPNKEIQFQRALLTVNGGKFMSLPLYSVNLSGGPSNFGEQIFTVNDNRVGINYPYYLNLSPGHTSLLRFETGQPSGRTLSGNSASALDYEMTWNRDDGSEGGLSITGINRPDWTLDAHHALHFNDGSSLTGLISSPARRSIFGSVGYNKPLNGFQLSLNSSTSKSLVGPQSDNTVASAIIESNPHKVKSIPLTLFYGLTASDTETKFDGQTQKIANSGLQLRGQFDQLTLDKQTSLNASFTVGQHFGTVNGLAFYTSLGLMRSVKGGSINLAYDLTDDNSLATLAQGGKQRLSLDSTYGIGKTSLHLFASKSLDANWTSLYGDMSYQVSGLYRLSAGYTRDQYLGSASLDYDLMLSYRLGVREVGVVWSRQTHRLGFEILGARF